MQVVIHRSSPQSYLIKVQGGRVLRRTRIQSQAIVLPKSGTSLSKPNSKQKESGETLEVETERNRPDVVGACMRMDPPFSLCPQRETR